jgi:hypothetical protein
MNRQQQAPAPMCKLRGSGNKNVPEESRVRGRIAPDRILLAKKRLRPSLTSGSQRIALAVGLAKYHQLT